MHLTCSNELTLILQANLPKISARLSALLPDAEFHHIGATAIPGAVTKGDVDVHHGYFLPHEGASNVAVALFSFPSLAAYEEYRTKSQSDADCCAAYEFEKKNRSIISYERTFMRPVFHEKKNT